MNPTWAKLIKLVDASPSKIIAGREIPFPVFQHKLRSVSSELIVHWVAKRDWAVYNSNGSRDESPFHYEICYAPKCSPHYSWFSTDRGCIAKVIDLKPNSLDWFDNSDAGASGEW